MPINPAISMGYKQPEFQDPLNSLARIMQVQGLQQQNELGRQTMEDQNALRADLAGGADPYAALIRRGKVKEAGDWRTSENTNAKAKAELVDLKTKQSREHLDMVKTPEEYIQWHLGNHADPILGPSLAARGITADQSMKSIREALGRPGGFEELLNQSRLGIAKYMELNKPSYQTRDAGGTLETVQLPGLGGPPTVVSSIKKTQSPDSVAANGLGYAKLTEDKRHHGVTEKHAGDANDLKKQEVEGDRSSGLPVLGVPVPTTTPWANQSNPKDANKVKAAESARGAKEIEKDADAARAAASNAQAIQRFKDLNEKVNTGGVSDKFGAGQWVNSFSPEYAEMESIAAKLIPAQRTPGSGTTSDADLAMFKRAVVGVDKSKKTNDNIANSLLADAQRTQDYADYRQTYLEQNGTLQGADRHWKGYVDKNPIFAPGSTDFTLNPKRQSWADYFKPKEAAAPGKPAPATPAGGPPADIAAILAQHGGKK